jgi:hypothetical protein
MARLDRFAGNFSFELRKRQQDLQGGQTTSFNTGLNRQCLQKSLPRSRDSRRRLKRPAALRPPPAITEYRKKPYSALWNFGFAFLIRPLVSRRIRHGDFVSFASIAARIARAFSHAACCQSTRDCHCLHGLHPCGVRISGRLDELLWLRAIQPRSSNLILS